MKSRLLLFLATSARCSPLQHPGNLLPPQRRRPAARATPPGFALGVGPVVLPDYIDRGELVFQSAPNKFEVPYEQRWAGSLRDTTTRVLGTNLARRLGTGNLHFYPWPPGTPLRYQVRVEVQQFHALSGGDAILEATWRIDDGTSGRVIRPRSRQLHRTRPRRWLRSRRRRRKPPPFPVRRRHRRQLPPPLGSNTGDGAQRGVFPTRRQFLVRAG